MPNNCYCMPIDRSTVRATVPFTFGTLAVVAAVAVFVIVLMQLIGRGVHHSSTNAHADFTAKLDGVNSNIQILEEQMRGTTNPVELAKLAVSHNKLLEQKELLLTQLSKNERAIASSATIVKDTFIPMFTVIGTMVGLIIATILATKYYFWAERRSQAQAHVPPAAGPAIMPIAAAIIPALGGNAAVPAPGGNSDQE